MHAGVSQSTVRAALATDEPPRHQQPEKNSTVDGVEPQVRALLRKFPTMPATVIAERIRWHAMSVSLCGNRIRVA